MQKILIYLHIIHLLKSSTCLEHYSARLREVYVIIVYMQPLVSSLSAGDCLVHRLTGAQDSLQEVYVVIVYMQPLVSSHSAGDCLVHRLTGAQDSHLQKVTIPEAAYIQLQRRPPEDEQSNALNM